MAQLYKRKGGEVLVNTETSGFQTASNLSALNDGGYIVVWTDASAIGADTSSNGIKAQRFDADGNKVGSEFLVNTTTTGSQTTASVTTLPSGRYVVTWTDSSGLGGDASASGIKGQLFEADGTRVGGEFLVNTETANTQSGTVVTELAGGGFVVSWQDNSLIGGDSSAFGIKAQLFDAAGAKVGGEFLVNAVTSGSQSSPSIAALASGGFAVAWNGAATGSGGLVFGSIRVQLFDSAGAKVGSELIANSSNDGALTNAKITAISTGFVVAWAQSVSATPGGTFDLRAQMFDASGTKVGAEFMLNTTTAGNQMSPDIDALPGGGFLATWQGDSGDASGVNIYGQVFDASGAKVGAEFVISSITDGSQSSVKVDVLTSGDIAVTWTDTSGVGGDTSSTGIKTQILTLSSDAPTDMALSNATVSETSIDNLPVATLSATGALNTTFTYAILSDTSGGAFRIEGDKLVVDDNHRLDFETHGSVDVTIRATDLNGHAYDETFTLTVANAAIEARYAASDQLAPAPPLAGDFQGLARITQLVGGRYLATWEEVGSGAAPHGVRGQLFDAAGASVGGEFAASDGGRTGQFSIVALAGGGFISVYEGDSIDLGGGSNGFPINAQVFDVNGAPVGGQILVSSTNATILSDPEAALLANGSVVVVWTLPTDENGAAFGSQIAAQILDANGNKVGGEFRVNTQTDGGQAAPHVIALESGGFLVTWADDDTRGFNAQKFDDNGTKVGGQFEILSTLPNDEDGSIAALDGGGFVAVLGSEDASSHQIEAHIFDAGGTQIGNILVVGPQDLNLLSLGTPHVGGLPGGGFVVSWSTGIVGSESAIVTAQIFDAVGHAVGDTFLVEDLGENASDEFLTTTSDGDILLGWLHSYRDSVGNPQGDVRWRVFTTADILGTAGNDLLTGTSGNDDMHGYGGNDGFFFGANFTAADRVDGGDGDNDQIGLQGDYTGANALTLEAGTITNVEAIVVLPGFSYDLTLNDGNVAAGGLLKVQATQLAAGQSLHFDGSAEHDGTIMTFGGQGDDSFTGGWGNDGFYFGPGGYTSADVVNGGLGNNDQLGLDGDYGSVGSPLVLGTNVTNVEVVVLMAGPAGTPNHFNVSTVDGFVGSGQTMTIFGLQTSTGFTFDGSNEHDGAFKVYGGTGNDVITGGTGADWIFGGDGADTLRGGAGNDTFYYDSVTQSTSAGRDGIQDFATGDKMDLSAIDAINGGGDDAFSFIGSGAFTNHAGELRAVTTGGGIWTVSGDTDGNGVADFEVVVVVTDAHPLTSADFTL